MRLNRLFSRFGNLPKRFGGALAASLFLASVSCDRKGTPNWDTPSSPAVTAKEAQSPEFLPPAALPPSRHSSGPGIRLITYNVKNWLTVERYVDRSRRISVPKPPEEKRAIVTLLVRHQPDLIGLCEIGTTADLAEIQQTLERSGLDLPHAHHVGGSDPVRHLGFLSRFPILSTARPAETGFWIEGKSYAISRGIMDVSLEAHGKPYRFLGVHLKSKSPTPAGDETLIRTHEAQLLRRHVDSILEADPEARLVVYGDFNDTRPNAPFTLITGLYNSPTYLAPVHVKDSRQESWTYFWKLHEVYSRIDFITTSRALREEVDREASRILDDPEWSIGSDHRPILTVLK